MVVKFAGKGAFGAVLLGDAELLGCQSGDGVGGFRIAHFGSLLFFFFAEDVSDDAAESQEAHGIVFALGWWFATCAFDKAGRLGRARPLLFAIFDDCCRIAAN